MNNIWLFALFLVVPVLVHLFSFRRAKKQLFSTLKFIKKVNAKSKNKSRLKYLLILTTRILIFISILVLLFSFLSSKRNQEDIKSSILVDATPSMSIETDGDMPLNKVDKYLDALSSSLAGGSIMDAEYRSSFDKITSDLFNKYAVLISDFQGVNLENLARLASDSLSTKQLILLGQINEYKNVYIDSLSIDYNIDDFSKLQITVFPKVSDSFNEGTIILRLLSGNRQLSSVVKSIDELSTVIFDIPIEISGELILEIEGDGVFYDNEFRFIIANSKKPVVSVLDKGDNQYLKAVFGNDDLFECNFIDPNNINYELIESSDLIMLNAYSDLPTGLEAMLSNKSVIYFPSPSSSLSVSELSGLNLSAKSDTSRFAIQVDFNHPIFSGVYENIKGIEDLPKASTILTIDGSYEPILILRNGDPLLVKLTNSDFYLFNANVDPTESDLPTHSIFLPILYKIAFQSVNNDNQAYYYPNDLAELDVVKKEASPKIISTDLEIIPEFNPSANGITFKVPDLAPGFYSLLHETDSFRIAVNVPKNESIMQGLTIQELQDYFDDNEYISVQSSEALHYLSSAAEIGIWKYALILIVLLILTETLFHKYLQ